MLYSKDNIKDELHADPLNLKFYLIKDGLGDLTFEIIKKKTIKSIFGNIEIAIIGSSHYLKLADYFTEIMTCSPEEINEISNILLSEKGTNNFNHSLKFDSFKYNFSAETIGFSNVNLFTKYEQTLLKKKEIFAHRFFGDSAITALKYTESSDSFLFESWHTYPQQNKIIYSQTELSNF